MFHPLECFIGFRYVRARAHRGFVSFISLTSLSGIGLGVAALIVILSVMNGFESELRDSPAEHRRSRESLRPGKWHRRLA